MSPINGGSENFYSVDFLRGIASIFILVVHYSHFFEGGGQNGAPLSAIVNVDMFELWSPIYYWGANAVQFFWLISGFVFVHVYGGRIGVSSKEFLVHRIARLYPLHLITLIAIALMQWINMRHFGHYDIYYINDTKHFILNLFFASEWGWQDGRSFNGPIWSVSVELFSYGIFLFILKSIRLTIASVLLVIALAMMSYVFWNNSILLCVIYFFSGCLVYSLLNILRKYNVGFTFLISMIVCLLLIYTMSSNNSIPRLFLYAPLFGSILIMACLLEYRYGSMWLKRIRWVGNTSYGNYLWHTPIQLLFLMFVSLGFVNLNVIYGRYFLGAYMATVITVSLLSFRFFERPMQAFVRSACLTRIHVHPRWPQASSEKPRRH
jgi:peptidoglycan/LPS O-acetylase OafA/YrhL